MVLERWDVLILDEKGNSCNRHIEFEDDIIVDIYTNFIKLFIKDIEMNIYYSGLALTGKKGSLHIFKNDNTKNNAYIILEYYYDYFANRLWTQYKSPRLFYIISKYAIDHKKCKWIGITKEDKINFIEWARLSSPRCMPKKVLEVLSK